MKGEKTKGTFVCFATTTTKNTGPLSVHLRRMEKDRRGRLRVHYYYYFRSLSFIFHLFLLFLFGCDSHTDIQSISNHCSYVCVHVQVSIWYWKLADVDKTYILYIKSILSFKLFHRQCCTLFGFEHRTLGLFICFVTESIFIAAEGVSFSLDNLWHNIGQWSKFAGYGRFEM